MQEEIMENLGVIIQENIIPMVIVIFLLIYWVVSKFRESTDKNTVAIRDKWSAVASSKIRLTDQFYATVADYDKHGFSFSGELYQIDSQTYDSIVETERAVFLTQDEIKELEEQNSNNEDFDSQIEIHENDEKEKYIIEKSKAIEKRKSVTGLAKIPHPGGGRLVAIRRSDLRETETILSETEQQKLVYLDPTLTLKHTRFALFGVMVYEFILLYMMVSETDPALLFAPTSYPWYVLLVVVWVLRVKNDEQKIGYKALYRGMELGEESFTIFSAKGEEITLTVPVYEVELHYHPMIPIKNLLKGIGKEEIETKTMKTLERRVTQLSAENTSLNSRLEQYNQILAHKDTQLVASRNEHVKSFNDGFIHGYTKHQVKNDDQPLAYMQSGGTSGIEWFREIKLPLVGLLVIGAIFFLGKGIAESISNATITGDFNIFTTDMLLGLLGIIVIILLLSRFTKS